MSWTTRLLRTKTMLEFASCHFWISHELERLLFRSIQKSTSPQRSRSWQASLLRYRWQSMALWTIPRRPGGACTLYARFKLATNSDKAAVRSISCRDGQFIIIILYNNEVRLWLYNNEVVIYIMHKTKHNLSINHLDLGCISCYSAGGGSSPRHSRDSVH